MNDLEDRVVVFAARCVKVCAALPVKNVGSANFADQLFRSSTSVAANYAEACEAESGKDFRTQVEGVHERVVRDSDMA